MQFDFAIDFAPDFRVRFRACIHPHPALPTTWGGGKLTPPLLERGSPRWRASCLTGWRAVLPVADEEEDYLCVEVQRGGSPACSFASWASSWAWVIVPALTAASSLGLRAATSFALKSASLTFWAAATWDRFWPLLRSALSCASVTPRAEAAAVR